MSGQVGASPRSRPPPAPVKARQTLDLIVVGVTDPLTSPTTLLLATRPPDGDQLHPAGSSTVLSKTAARSIGRLMTATGASSTRPSVWAGDAAGITLVEPVVAEVDADIAVTADGTLRHGARLLRVRPDLDPTDVDTALT